jgi:hypothetical protein
MIIKLIILIKLYKAITIIILQMDSKICEPVVKEVKDLYVLEIFNQFTKGGCIYLHDIQSIDGIDVNVFINKTHNKKDLFCKIESKTVYRNGDAFELYNGDIISVVETDNKLADFEQGFYGILSQLQELSFDKIHSRFVKKPTVSMCLAFPELFKSGKIISSHQVCSICYELTRQKTNCNHSLCFPCWSKIKEIKIRDDDEDALYVRPCPICRVDLNCD